MTSTSLVWVKRSDASWIAGEVASIDGEKRIVRLTSAETAVFGKDSADCLPRNPPGRDTNSNLVLLEHLDEPNLLHAISLRYSQQQIYTRTGHILCAVNPWNAMNIYDKQQLAAYRQAAETGQLPSLHPHIFETAAHAHISVCKGKHESILVSGDSGAGKTESTKLLIRYLASCGQGESGAQSLVEEQVVHSNPLLESLGNAKTVRNDNSSRFGKFVSIFFDGQGRITCSSIQTYLLESSRVSNPPQNERNFHILYQMCASHNEVLLKDLQLGPAKDFEILRAGSSIAVANIDDAKGFHDTLRSMQVTGLSPSSILNVMRMLALVLHVGNICIVESQIDGKAFVPPGQKSVAAAALLFSVSPDDLVATLTSRQYSVTVDRRSEKYTVPLSCEQAVAVRGACMRHIYKSVFDFVILSLNLALGCQEHRDRFIGSVSVLDIYGFEHFQVNRWEQFIINYVNEKLQLLFNETNFVKEMEEYQLEQITWDASQASAADSMNLAPTLDFIEGRQFSFITLLDEECLVPSGSEINLVQKLSDRHGDHARFKVCKGRGTDFILCHYATDVQYTTTGFLDKNRDSLLPGLISLFQSSADTNTKHILLEQQMDVVSHSSAKRKSIVMDSVLNKFKASLSTLMERLRSTNVHFVRCINANSSKQSFLFDAVFVLPQLRCSGLIEAVRVARAGFSARLLHADFLHRYSILADIALQNTTKASVQSLCASLRILPDSHRIGLTKIFLRRAAYDKLELARSSMLMRYVVTLQASVRQLSVRSRYISFVKHRRLIASVVLQCVSRRSLCQPHYINLLFKLHAQYRLSVASAADAASSIAAGNSVASVQQMESRDIFEIPIGADAPSPPELLRAYQVLPQRSVPSLTDSTRSTSKLLDILRSMNAATTFSDIQRLLQSLTALQARGYDNFDEKDRACVDEVVAALLKRQNLCLLQEQAERNAVNEKQYELNQNQQILLQLNLEEHKKMLQRSQRYIFFCCTVLLFGFFSCFVFQSRTSAQQNVVRHSIWSEQDAKCRKFDRQRHGG
jgi:myosin-5